MLSRLYPILILCFLCSCSVFKGQNIKNNKIETLLTYLNGEGEGKGRLGINQNQYLFGFEAFLKDQKDWILAASIPLHGEEIIRLQNLKVAESDESYDEGLELRIERGLSEYLRSKKQSPEVGHLFLKELRQLMRFVLHKKLGVKVICAESECRMGESTYQVKVTGQQINLIKKLNSDYEIEYVASSLTDSIFKRSNIFLHSKNKSSSAPPLLSLELFWK